MIKKPVLGLAGVFLAGLTLTGCQSTPQKPFQPTNPGLAGARTNTNSPATSNAGMARNNQGGSSSFTNSGTQTGGAGSISQTGGSSSPMGGNSGYNINPPSNPSTNFGANPTSGAASSTGGSISRTSGSPTGPGIGSTPPSNPTFAPIDSSPMGTTGQPAPMGFDRAPTSNSAPIVPPPSPTSGTSTQYVDPAFGSGPASGPGSPSMQSMPALPAPPTPTR